MSSKNTRTDLKAALRVAKIPSRVVRVDEAEVIHFPIGHRHAALGTVHKWGDGHHYRKTAHGWDKVEAPGANHVPASVPAGPSKAEVPAAKDVAAPTKAPTEQPKADTPKAVAHPEPEKPAQAPAPAGQSVVNPDWKRAAAANDLKVGDEAEFRWTNSYNGYQARVRVTKKNQGSVRGVLLHDHGGYKAGREIVVPILMGTRSFNTKWSYSNGAFTVGEKTPAADDAAVKRTADAEAANGNGTAKNYKRGDRLVVAHAGHKPEEVEVLKSLYANNTIQVRTLHRGADGVAKPSHSYSIRLGGYPGKISRFVGGPGVAFANGAEGDHTHEVYDPETNLAHTSYANAAEAHTAADHMSDHHKRAFKVRAKGAATHGAPAPVVPDHAAPLATHKADPHTPVAQAAHAANLTPKAPEPLVHGTPVAPSNILAPPPREPVAADTDAKASPAIHPDAIARAAGGRVVLSTAARIGVPDIPAPSDAFHANMARLNRPITHEDHYLRSIEDIPMSIEAKPDHVSQEMHDAIVDFAHHHRAERAAHWAGGGMRGSYHFSKDPERADVRVHYKRGNAYVDHGGSGKYMIPIAPGKGKAAAFPVGTVRHIAGYGQAHAFYTAGNVLDGTAQKRAKDAYLNSLARSPYLKRV